MHQIHCCRASLKILDRCFNRYPRTTLSPHGLRGAIRSLRTILVTVPKPCRGRTDHEFLILAFRSAITEYESEDSKYQYFSDMLRRPATKKQPDISYNQKLCDYARRPATVMRFSSSPILSEPTGDRVLRVSSRNTEYREHQHMAIWCVHFKTQPSPLQLVVERPTRKAFLPSLLCF